MPDFSKMNEAKLKEFRLKKNNELRAIRDEIREAGKALEALRAEQDRVAREAAVAEYGAEAVAEASNIITAPPASGGATAPQLGG